ncbi:complement factor D-like isoform X2 [Daphnia carinata]|uniref:complement factor D-like isoform X2 n=1 Tax=Daphnia carinata TaxID=120202 RepID=UPI0028696619|nr:complement factor D-like isoform X2 [Daphnia carinata]
MLYALFVSVLFAFVTGAPNGDTGRLIGGTQATAGQFPFVVSISRQDQHICGGFIYNDRWVVTTAKCVVGKPQADLKVTVGALSLITPDPEEQIITILSIVLFELYEEATQKHDIALIELSRPIVFGSTAQAIRYDEIDELATPWEAAIVGWGATFEGGAPATRLRWAPIDNLAADCRAYGIDQYIQNFMICAGSDAGTVSPCQFDEGTPLTQMANYGGVPEEIVVGIMSKNQGCTDLSVPSIYTRLATYYSWLLQTAGQQPAPTRSLRNSK